LPRTTLIGTFAKLDAEGKLRVEGIPIRTGGVSEAALEGAIGAERYTRSLDGVVAALDQRKVAGPVFVTAMDSTGSPYSTGTIDTLKELFAEVWPDRPVNLWRWDKAGDACPATPTVWQTASRAATPEAPRRTRLSVATPSRAPTPR
jgi:hypothetical protein